MRNFFSVQAIRSIRFSARVSLLCALALAGSLGLSACGKKKPDHPHPHPTDSLPNPMGQSPQAAAEKGLAILKDMSKKPESFSVGGFESVEEAPLAKLGPAFMTFWVGCPALAPVDLAKPLSAFVFRSQVTHAVQVQDKPRSLIYVDSLARDSASSSSGSWAVTAMGDAPILQLYASAAVYFAQAPGKRETDVLVRIPGAQMMMRATGLREEDWVYPLEADSSFPCLGAVKEPLSWSALRKGLSACESALQLCSQKFSPPAANDSVKTNP